MEVDGNKSPVRSVSPDMFESSNMSQDATEDEEMTPAAEDASPKKTRSKESSVCHWKGAPLEELQQGFGLWGPPPLPPVQPSPQHTVLVRVPYRHGEVPAPYPRKPRDCWDQDHVRMPNSPESLYPVQESEDGKGLRLRWELVQEALLQSIMDSTQLEAAILSYNSRYNERWNFVALHSFFTDALGEEEADHFFQNLLPDMAHLALRLPELITGPVPLLRKHRSLSVTLSQLQIASLLANAFFCTFPRRNSTKRGSEYAGYPDINFNRLFQCDNSSVMEKLKCLLHYFRRVSSSAPEGVVTFSRRHMQPGSLPNWGNSKKLLTKFHITSTGFIENEGSGLLQVDFANKLVGGGVLGYGCVQEEIRFVICPELIVSRLFTESLDPTEALLIVGCERFSRYSGYASSFRWTGDFKDSTPLDAGGRRKCSLVAIDALCFSNPSSQYSLQSVVRELNKAYVGFCEPEECKDTPLAAIATGNWGCGAFQGDAHLKALLQLMAAAQAGRPLVYFTFQDVGLRDRIFQMYQFLVDNRITVGRLWDILCEYSRKSFSGQRSSNDLYNFIYSSVMKPYNKDESTSGQLSNSMRKSSSTSGLSSNKTPTSDRRASCGGSSSSKSNRPNNIADSGLTEADLEAAIEEYDSDNLEREAEHEGPLKKDMASAQPNSCLSLIEKSLGNDISADKNSNKPSCKLLGTKSSASSDKDQNVKSVTPAKSCSVQEAQTTSSVVDTCTTSNSVQCSSPMDVAEENIVSSSVSSASKWKTTQSARVTSTTPPVPSPQTRMNAPKRKISDYFNIV